MKDFVIVIKMNLCDFVNLIDKSNIIYTYIIHGF